MATNRKMLTAVFREHGSARTAYDWLRDHGYMDNEINVLMSDVTRAKYFSTKDERHEAGSRAAEGVGVGGAIGTAVGATLGAVVAIGTSLAIPGLGLIIAGPIAAALAGGGAGAVAGGLIGGLVGLGIPEANAKAYQEALRTGGVVLGVTPRNNEQARDIENEFKRLRAENICYC